MPQEREGVPMAILKGSGDTSHCAVRGAEFAKENIAGLNGISKQTNKCWRLLQGELWPSTRSFIPSAHPNGRPKH